MAAISDPIGSYSGRLARGVDGGRRPHLLRPEGAPKRAVWGGEGREGLSGPIQRYQRAPSDAESSTFLGCRRQIRRIPNTSCRKSFLKLRSDWPRCRFPPKLWANPPGGLCMARQLGPRCACRPSHWPWPPALAQGCSWLPSMCQAWAITPRAPSADRLCASERREQIHAAFSEASRSVWLQRGQKWAGCSLASLALPSLHALHALRTD